MNWWISAGLLVSWFLLRFVIGKRGWVHFLLMGGLTLLVIQIAAYRKTQYQKNRRDAENLDLP
jgi:hypothetical protein